MTVKKGFVVAALIALVYAVLSKLVAFWIQNDPKTFGIEAPRLAWILQLGMEIGLFVSVGLVCLGLLNSQTTKRSVKDRFKDIPNPFDDPYWSVDRATD